MDKCDRCEFEAFEEDVYCRQCGNQLSLQCSECDAVIEDNDKFCHSCGAELGEVVSEDESSSF